jgi:hypothetical protein
MTGGRRHSPLFGFAGRAAVMMTLRRRMMGGDTAVTAVTAGSGYWQWGSAASVQLDQSRSKLATKEGGSEEGREDERRDGPRRAEG